MDDFAHLNRESGFPFAINDADVALQDTTIHASQRSRLPKVMPPMFLQKPQKQAPGAMLQNAKGALADEMGVGKTLPRIVYIA